VARGEGSGEGDWPMSREDRAKRGQNLEREAFHWYLHSPIDALHRTHSGEEREKEDSRAEGRKQRGIRGSKRVEDEAGLEWDEVVF